MATNCGVCEDPLDLKEQRAGYDTCIFCEPWVSRGTVLGTSLPSFKNLIERFFDAASVPMLWATKLIENYSALALFLILLLTLLLILK